ncbi:hypothetical protein P9112_001254 [Eukaryota sp. TZLM1-RC]
MECLIGSFYEIQNISNFEEFLDSKYETNANFMGGVILYPIWKKYIGDNILFNEFIDEVISSMTNKYEVLIRIDEISMKIESVFLFLQKWKIYSSVTPKKELVPARLLVDPFLLESQSLQKFDF